MSEIDTGSETTTQTDYTHESPQLQPVPEVPISQEVLARMAEQHDSPRSQEIKLGDGLTLTVGVRELYYNFDGEVYAVPHSGKAPAA